MTRSRLRENCFGLLGWMGLLNLRLAGWLLLRKIHRTVKYLKPLPAISNDVLLLYDRRVSEVEQAQCERHFFLLIAVFGFAGEPCAAHNK